MQPTESELDGEEAISANDYLEIVSQYDREFKRYEAKVDKIIKRYRDDGRQTNYSGSRFNILWSNVQTLVPATFSRLPQPDVSRRFRDNDPVGRVAALLLERALEYEIQHYPDYAATMKQSVLDRFLGGRGTAWVRYEPHFKAAEYQLPLDGVEISEDVDEPNEQLDYECSPCDYVNYKDFGHSIARTWEEVTCVWRVVYMNEDAVEERFGEELAAKIPYDSSPDTNKNNKGGEKSPKQAKIYEIWDKERMKAVWISKSLNQIIDERDDPLELAGFFPCPRPLYATLTNETLVPVPDYVLYQDQANELDVLATRIDGLIKALQVKGVYDAATPELGRLFTEGNNTDLIPVKNFTAFAEKQGLKGSLDIIDLMPFVNALKTCYEAVDQVKNHIYEITGISDILRGETDAMETLGAQQIKQNNAGLRLKTMQESVAVFAAQLLQIKAQIICCKYSPQTIIQISAADQLSDADKQYIEPAIQLLVGQQRISDPAASVEQNPLRSFRIEVQADSLVQLDEAQEKQNRLEFLKAAGGFIKDALPIVQEAPEAAPLIVQMLKFGVTAFKVGKTIEGDFDQALDQLKQQAMQPKQPKPDPELIKIQAQSQAAQQEMQIKAQLDQQNIQMQAQLEAHKQELQHQQISAQNQMEAQREALAQQNEASLKRMEMMMEERMASVQGHLEILLANLNNAAKVEVAEIGAGSTLQAAQISAAQSAEPT